MPRNLRIRDNIFLSHSTADSQWVKWIAANAQQVGVDVYLYEHDLQPGELVTDKLQAAMQSCDAVVVLLTDNSHRQAYVQQEIGYAKALRKPVIPLVQPGVGQESLAMLEGVDRIPFDYHSPQEALRLLLPHLQRLKQTKENKAILFGFGALVALALLSR